MAMVTHHGGGKSKVFLRRAVIAVVDVEYFAEGKITHIVKRGRLI